MSLMSVRIIVSGPPIEKLEGSSSPISYSPTSLPPFLFINFSVSVPLLSDKQKIVTEEWQACN